MSKHLAVASTMVFFLFTSPVWSTSLNGGETYYSIQLIACKYDECRKNTMKNMYNRLEGEEYTRIEQEGAFHVLKVGFWKSKETALTNLQRLRSRFRNAHFIRSEYRPEHMVVKNWEAHGEQSAAETEGSETKSPQNIEVYKELGYLYAEEAEYAKAAKSWEKYLSFEYDPVIAFRFGKMQRLIGRIDDALETLEAIVPNDLSPTLQAERLDELAKIYVQKEQLDKAVAALIEASAIELSPHRHYRLGLIYRTQEKQEDYIYHLEQANALDPGNNTYAVALGYAYKDAAKHKETSELFEEVVVRDPDYLKLYEELGYMFLYLIDNDEAVEWFKRSIDNEPLYPVHTDEEREELVRTVTRMKQEVGKLTNRFDLTLYQSLRTDSREQFTTTGGTIGGGSLPSQGGVEFSYQPPLLGFRNERVFQVFGRMLWSTEPRSLKFVEDSLQGGIGARYKPLRTHNLFLSAERLIEIGDDAVNDWLLRLLYSWNYGFDLRPGKPFWNYTLLYGDLGYFVEDNLWAFFGAGRQGITFNKSDTYLITPHLVVEGRVQEPSVPTGSYIEGGLGLSLKMLFNKSPYTLYNSSFEFIAQYKAGRFIRDTDTLEDKTFDGFVFTGILQF